LVGAADTKLLHPTLPIPFVIKFIVFFYILNKKRDLFESLL
jgi:hypothetical protein